MARPNPGLASSRTGPVITVLLNPTGAVVTAGTTTTQMQLIGANVTPHIAGIESLPGKVNYLRSKDPKHRHANVATYGKVKYTDVYPGIDLVYYGQQRQLEYDFIVAPGVDSEVVRLRFSGAMPRLDKSRDLTISELSLHKPVLYQRIAGKRKPVDGRFLIAANKDVGFQIGAYDKTQSLVIDPVLSYSTYLGGSRGDQANAIAVDALGQVYIAGKTNSIDFPVAKAPQSRYGGGNSDAFIAKLTANGGALVNSTYLGGSSNEGSGINYFWETLPTSIAVDGKGQAYVTGVDISLDFPMNNALQASYRGGRSDAFLVKFGKKTPP